MMVRLKTEVRRAEPPAKKILRLAFEQSKAGCIEPESLTLLPTPICWR